MSSKEDADLYDDVSAAPDGSTAPAEAPGPSAPAAKAKTRPVVIAIRPGASLDDDLAGLVRKELSAPEAAPLLSRLSSVFADGLTTARRWLIISGPELLDLARAWKQLAPVGVDVLALRSPEPGAMTFNTAVEALGLRTIPTDELLGQVEHQRASAQSFADTHPWAPPNPFGPRGSEDSGPPGADEPPFKGGVL